MKPHAFDAHGRLGRLWCCVFNPVQVLVDQRGERLLEACRGPLQGRRPRGRFDWYGWRRLYNASAVFVNWTILLTNRWSTRWEPIDGSGACKPTNVVGSKSRS